MFENYWGLTGGKVTINGCFTIEELQDVLDIARSVPEQERCTGVEVELDGSELLL
jgi:hypothetical protein